MIAKNVVVPTSLLDQSLGLLKYKTPSTMLLRTHFGIHTLGMYYPIDVLILNKQDYVVAIKENLKPNNIFIWNINYGTVLELPKGTIKKTKTKLKDQLYLITE
jgi:hypothetical protein